jgi:hypothetical protein
MLCHTWQKVEGQDRALNSLLKKFILVFLFTIFPLAWPPAATMKVLLCSFGGYKIYPGTEALGQD